MDKRCGKAKGGACATEEQLLFGKYRLIRKLGKGQSGIVYLAEHVGLSAPRAVKVIARNSERCDAYLKEARLLKSLHHFGIPIIYDIEEDTSSAYIIEEYLDGESVASLIGRVGKLPASRVLEFGIQLCNIISYLHSLEFPIIHLDIQPNNLIICGNCLKLLDFGNAVLLSEAGSRTERCGTPDFAAPEQYADGRLNQTTDIYAIGVLLYFMAAAGVPGNGKAFADRSMEPRLGQIIGRCMQQDQNRRYGSAEELKEQLVSLQEQTGVFKAYPEPSLVLAVYGTGPGAGATHFAMGLACYLNRRGISCLYEDRNQGRPVWELAACDPSVKQIGSIYFKGACPMLPSYGGSVEPEKGRFQVYIEDYGFCREAEGPAGGASECCLIVSGSRPWELAEVLALQEQHSGGTKKIWLYNHWDPGTKKRAKELHGEEDCGFLPYFPDPFVQDERTKAWFDRLAARLGIKDVRKRRLPWGFFIRKPRQ